MSQRQNRRRPQCSHDNCGSRRLHVAEDGFTYCNHGHQQSELGTVIAEDTGELVTLGKTSRRKADSDVESQTSRVSGFSGPKAFEHYLLCLQLVLRKQLRWIIDVQDLPRELEVSELSYMDWLLSLCSCPTTTIPTNKKLHVFSFQAAHANSTIRQSLVHDLWALHLQKRRDKASNDSGTDTEAGGSQYFSSQSENDTDAGSTRSKKSRQGSLKKLKLGGPSLKDITSLVYIGVLFLRIPLTVADLHDWINNGDLVYYSAAKEIPLSMLDRLPGEYQRLLEPQSQLSPENLHKCILELLSTMHTEFGMGAPPLNDPLVLFRWVKELCLPLETYVAAQRLGRILQFDYAYTVGAQAWSNISLRYPEIRLMALVVIATKLLFPFDDIRRYPTSTSDLAALKMDWNAWVQLQTQAQDTADNHGHADRLTYEDCFTMSEKETVGLAGGRLDEYLDWYETNVASEEVRERGRAGREADFRKALFKLFPTSRDARVQPEIDVIGTTPAERLHQVQAAQRPNRVLSRAQADDVQRPGSSYIQYKAEDDLAGTIKIVYEKAAHLAGSSLAGMVRAVFSMERRLVEREKELRRHDLEESSITAA